MAPGSATNQHEALLRAAGDRRSLERTLAPEPAGTGTALSPGRAVLVVDDSSATRGAIAEVLRESGYVVYEAASLRETESLTRSVSEIPELALVDFTLPDAKGDRVATRLLERWP